MNIDYRKVIKIDELADLVPRKAGATWNSLWQIMYYTRMFKYVHKRQYPKIKASFNKICTHEKLQTLCKLGYLKNPQRDIYTATNSIIPILKEAGYCTELLPNVPEGKGDINELHNTEIFIQLAKLPHFKMLLFPHFGYVIPDAFLVQIKEDVKEYKLTFIEVERNKPKWEEYIERKRDNYLRLSKDIKVYEYWKSVCEKLNISIPTPEDFCFTVSFYGTIKKDFGTNFNFYHV